MVLGVLGTVIALERAVAIGRLWAYAAPAASVATGVLLLAHAPRSVVTWASALSALALVAIFASLLRRDPTLHTSVLALGALALLAGGITWALGEPIAACVPFWETFVVLTIAGERLELTRVLPPSAFGRAMFIGCTVLLVAGLAGARADLDTAPKVRGAAMVLLALWLARFDVARRTIAKSGATRYMAVNMLAGFVWLAVGGALVVRDGDLASGPLYDASVHALFVGFVFSMIFAHAPIILPAVAGIELRYSPLFYVHAAVLQAGIVARLVGDLSGVPSLRAWGGLVSTAAIVLFAANTARSALLARRDAA